MKIIIYHENYMKDFKNALCIFFICVLFYYETKKN